MCNPYTRGVYVVLQSLRTDGSPTLDTELTKGIDDYDKRIGNLLSLGAVRNALSDLLWDGSIERVDKSNVRITEFGKQTMQHAHGYMTRP